MVAHPRTESIRVELLAGFRVIVDGQAVREGAWAGRRSRELVQLLVLSDGHRLLRDQAIDSLWPHLGAQAAAANLRKAAHYARQALGIRDAVVLRAGWVSLLPSHRVETDVEEFERAATSALAAGDPGACTAAASAYGGDLLPGSLYEEWTQTPRRELRARYVRLLQRSAQWERVAELEPTDERAYQELMREALTSGSRHAAIRWYGRLRTTLARELGLLPSSETEALYEECLEGLAVGKPEFVGRQVELAKATALLRSTRDGAPGALVVRGPAGIGKSALCLEVAALARSEGWVAITVTAAEGAPPYAPLAAAIEQLVRHDRAWVDAVQGQPRAVLAELTSLAGPALPLDGGLTRHKVIGALRRLFSACGDAAGVVLVLDDAHLADEATTGALLHLVGGAGPQFLAVLAYRDELAPTALTRGTAPLRRSGGLVEIDLGPLDRDDAAALVAMGAPAPPDARAVAQIAGLAKGNPFFVLELARHVDAGGSLTVGPTVWDAVTERFIDLDDAAVEMLKRLAMAGDDLDSVSVVALTGLPEQEAFALLDLALGTGALVVSGAGYRFRHELVRQALMESVPPHRRIAIHRDAARGLAAAGGQPARVARHWLDGGRPGEAVDWLLAAARQAVGLGAFVDALGHLDSLLEHAAQHADGLCLRAEVLDALGDTRASAAYATAARIIGEPAAQEIRPRQALAQLRSGDPAGAFETLKGVAPSSLPGRLCAALTVSAAAVVGFGDPQVAKAKADEARRLADELGDGGAIVDASWAQSLAAHARGDLTGQLRAQLRATHGLPELAIRVFDGHLCATDRLLYGAMPYPELIAFADSLASEADRLGARRGHAFAVTLRGQAKLLSGQLDQADGDLAAGVREHQLIAAPAGEAIALERRAEVALYRGRLGDANALLREALAAARDSNLPHHLLDRIYGVMIAAAADPHSALAAVEEAESTFHGPAETCPACRIGLVVPAAIATARAGDLERAARYAETAELLANVVLLQPAWYAAVDEVKGHLARAAGDAEAALELFRQAAAGFRDSGQPLDEERCRSLGVHPAGVLSA
jgi:DNA-binding SARP family transcriptional activator/tetratricopeptide (TPR) repeat protein